MNYIFHKLNVGLSKNRKILAILYFLLLITLESIGQSSPYYGNNTKIIKSSNLNKLYKIRGKSRFTELDLSEISLDNYTTIVSKFKKTRVVWIDGNNFPIIKDWFKEDIMPFKIKVKTPIQENIYYKSNLRLNLLLKEISGEKSSLSKVDFSNCNLTSIRNEMYLLTTTKEIDLSYNKLNILPRKFKNQLDSLSNLDLSQNYFRNERINIPNSVKSLNLSNNYIMSLNSIPKKNLKKINALIINGNKNINLKRLNKADNLQFLGLSNCDLNSFNYKIKSLDYLDLSFNKIEEINFSILDRIESLNLSKNQIKIISLEANGKEKYFDEIILRGNPLKKLFIAKSVKVNNLNLSEINSKSLLEIECNGQVNTLIISKGFFPKLDIQKKFPGTQIVEI